MAEAVEEEDHEFVIVDHDVSSELASEDRNEEGHAMEPGAAVAAGAQHDNNIVANKDKLDARNGNNAAHSVLSDDIGHPKTDTISLSGWSEVSNVASIHSLKSHQSNPIIANCINNNNINNNNNDEMEGKLESSEKNDNENEKEANGMNYENEGQINNNKSKRKRKRKDKKVPFSYSEITRIQPKFGGNNKQHRLRIEHSKFSNKSKKIKKNEKNLDDIPETDPQCNKIDLGRKKKNVKYPNGRRGSRRNPRKRNNKE